MAAPPDIVKRALRRILNPKTPRAQESSVAAGRDDALMALIDRIREAPLDPGLCYDLGVELLRKGIDTDGVRYLDRSFRLDPMNIVRFVKTPDLKEIRLRDSVVGLLTRVRRDEEQRSYGGYA
jgi:hypothetical protein